MRLIKLESRLRKSWIGWPSIPRISKLWVKHGLYEAKQVLYSGSLK